MTDAENRELEILKSKMVAQLIVYPGTNDKLLIERYNQLIEKYWQERENERKDVSDDTKTVYD